MKRRSTEEIVLSSDDESAKDQLADKSCLKTKEKPVASREVIELRKKVTKLEKDFEGASQEVIELRQKVAKLEKDYQGACRYAREFELRMEEEHKRVEFLENLIDQKPSLIDATKEKLVDEHQKKIEELSNERDQLARKLAEHEGNREKQQLAAEQYYEVQKREDAKSIEMLWEERDELRRKLAQYEGERTKIKPVDSQEVLELQQKVVKLEKDFEGACRHARQFELQKEEAQKRVEFLENLIDKKPIVVASTELNLAEELQKKIDELTSKLAQADSVQDKLVKEQKKVRSLTKELEEEKSQANDELRRSYEKVRSLTKDLESERSQAKKDRSRYRTKIDDLWDDRKKLERKLDEADERERLVKKQHERSMQHNAVDKTGEDTKKPLKAVARIAPEQQPIQKEVDQAVENNLYQRYVKEILGGTSDDGEKASENVIDQFIGIMKNMKEECEHALRDFLKKKINFSEVTCLQCSVRIGNVSNFVSHLISSYHVKRMKNTGVSKTSVVFFIDELAKKNQEFKRLTVVPATAAIPSAGGISTHTLINSGTDKIMFKITSNNSDCDTNVAFGFIDAGSDTQFEITRVAGPIQKCSFYIHFAVAPEGALDAKEALKTVTAPAYLTLPIKAI